MEKGKGLEGDDENKYQHNSTMLMVGNLDESVSDEVLYEHVNQFPGLVVWCIRDHDLKTNKPLSHAFINYSNPQEAAIAIEHLDSTLLVNKPIRVNYSPCHRDSEESRLFVTNLDISVDKTSLHAIFSNYGKILSFKLCTDASGLCSGSAFVFYNCFASAQTAIEHLDGALINNKQIQVRPRRLYNENRKPEVLSVIFSPFSFASKSHLWNFFSKYGPIASVSEYTHHKEERFGFVTFENPKDASRAARDAPNHKRFNRDFKLSGHYADAVDEDQVDFKQLHVRNLDQAITDYSLKSLFFSYGCLFSCKVLRDSNGTSTGSGLVQFATNKEASKALHEMNGQMILGKTLCITLEKVWKSKPKMLPNPMIAMTPRPPLPLPPYPPPLMHPPGGFGVGFSQQMYPPGGFCLGVGQQMFYGQTPPTLYSLEPGYWYQQQLISGVRLPAEPLTPNTFVPRLIPGMRSGARALTPNSLCQGSTFSRERLCRDSVLLYEHID